MFIEVRKKIAITITLLCFLPALLRRSLQQQVGFISFMGNSLGWERAACPEAIQKAEQRLQPVFPIATPNPLTVVTHFSVDLT